MNTFVRRSQAFSLVELLAGVAVIGIVSALLMTAMRHVRDAANLSGCASNLRELGVAMHMYAQENGGMVVPYRATSNQSDVGYYRWNELLSPFLDKELGGQTYDTASAVFYCPAFLDEGHRRVQNGFATSYVLNRHVSVDLFGLNPEERVYLVNVKEPSRVLFLADGLPHDAGGTAALRNYSHTIAGSDGCRVNYRQHVGGAHLLFIDGHVEQQAGEPDGADIYHDGSYMMN